MGVICVKVNMHNISNMSIAFSGHSTATCMPTCMPTCLHKMPTFMYNMSSCNTVEPPLSGLVSCPDPSPEHTHVRGGAGHETISGLRTYGWLLLPGTIFSNTKLIFCPLDSCACWSGASDLCKLSIQHATTVFTQSALRGFTQMLSGQYNWIWTLYYSTQRMYFSVMGIFLVMDTPWSHATRIREVLYHACTCPIPACIAVCQHACTMYHTSTTY